MGSWSASGVYIPDYDETNYHVNFATGVGNLETALAARTILRATAADAAANLQSGHTGITGTHLAGSLGVGLGVGTLPGAGVTTEVRGTGTQLRVSRDGDNRLDATVDPNGDATLDASGDDLTLPDRVQFTHPSAPIVSAKAGPNVSQQHTIPAVASDTFAVLAAAQALTNKAISGGSINNTPIGATTPSTGAFTSVSATTSVTTPTVNTASGDLTLNPASGYVVPPAPYTGYLGSQAKKWLGLWGAELNVSTLVASSVLATVGGRILVGPTTTLIADLTAVSTTIDVKHNQMASGDRAYLEGNGQVEYLAITSGPTAITGGYRYSVTRNLDGSGANAWSAGDAVFNTGTTGLGWLELYSSTGMTGVGPAIAAYKRTGTAYNAFAPWAAFGHLSGLCGKGAGVWGFAAGDYTSGNYITANSADGFKLVAGTGGVQIDGTGIWLIGKGDGTSYLGWRNDGATTVTLDGYYTAGTGTIQADLAANPTSGSYNSLLGLHARGQLEGQSDLAVLLRNLEASGSTITLTGVAPVYPFGVLIGRNLFADSDVPSATLEVRDTRSPQWRVGYDATKGVDYYTDVNGNQVVTPYGTWWILTNGKKFRLNAAALSDVYASAAGEVTVETPTGQGLTVKSAASPLLTLVDTASPTPWSQTIQMEANGYGYLTNNGNGYRLRGKSGANTYLVLAPANEAVSLSIIAATDGNTYVYPSGGAWLHDHYACYHRSFAKSSLIHSLQFHGDGTAPAANAEALFQLYRVNSDAIGLWQRFSTAGTTYQWDIGIPANSADLWFRRTADAAPGFALLYATQMVQSNWQFKFAGNVGFYGAAPSAKPTVTGSRGGNAALASLLTGLAGLGLLTDSTTA